MSRATRWYRVDTARLLHHSVPIIHWNVRCTASQLAAVGESSHSGNEHANREERREYSTTLSARTRLRQVAARVRQEIRATPFLRMLPRLEYDIMSSVPNCV